MPGNVNVGRTSIDVEARPYSNIHTEHQAHRVGLDAAFGGGGTVEEYYSYDAVGNRTAETTSQNDTLRVTSYNRLNLPEEYTTASGDEVQYVYSADGEKLFVQLTTSANVTTGTEYAANYRVENGTLTMIHTDAGYYTPVPPPSGVGSPTYNHIWYLKDHLGNNRVLADASGTVYAVNDYDPFGNSMTSPITGTQPSFPAGTTASPYKYGGKEWNTTTSTYDFEARQMAPGFHRFTTMDPLCEKYYSISPYAYCADNPVNLVDPEGHSPQVVGALVGAGLDMGLQVATNLIQGEKWYKIDVKSVLISAGAGAVGAGFASKVKQAKHLVDIGKVAVAAGEAVVEGTVSGAESVVRQYTYDGSLSVEETLADAAIGTVSSLFGSGAKAAKQASSRGKQELRNLKNRRERAERVAKGNNPKASRQAAVEKTKKQIETYGDKRKTAVSAAMEFIVSTFKEYMYYNEERRNE